MSITHPLLALEHQRNASDTVLPDGSRSSLPKTPTEPWSSSVVEKQIYAHDLTRKGYFLPAGEVFFSG